MTSDHGARHDTEGGIDTRRLQLPRDDLSAVQLCHAAPSTFGVAAIVRPARAALPTPPPSGLESVASRRHRGQGTLMDMDRLEGKVALVTGAGSGIGRASAMRFAAEGAAVLCTDLNEASAQETAATIAEGGGSSAALQVDVTDEDAVQAACEAAVRELGGLDVLMNTPVSGARRGTSPSPST